MGGVLTEGKLGTAYISVTEARLCSMLRSPGSQDKPGASPWCGEVVPEVVGAFPLPEATAGHDADASLLQELHAVEHVRGHAMGLREQGRMRASHPALHKHSTENVSKHSGNSSFP